MQDGINVQDVHYLEFAACLFGLSKKVQIRACEMEFFQKKNMVCCTIIWETSLIL